MKNTALVKKAIKGNEEAFETLIKHESEKLYRMAFLYVRNKEDALDVVQETVCKAFVSIKQVKNPEFFQTWLTRILIHCAYEVLRKRKTLLLEDDLMSSIMDERHKDSGDRLDMVNAIARLNENYQTALILFYYQDLPIHSIAKAMEKPENTIKTYLRRAKLELKEIIEGVGPSEQRAF